jgi:hypothetical protein
MQRCFAYVVLGAKSLLACMFNKEDSKIRLNALFDSYIKAVIKAKVKDAKDSVNVKVSITHKAY